MTVIKHNDSSAFYHRICIVVIWLIVFYSSIIQYKFIEIPHGMLLLGSALLFFFYLANIGKPFVYRESITEENIYMLWFMAYMLATGLLFSPDRSNHISQWMTCLEYLFVQIVIAFIIQKTGTDTFHILLLIEALVLACIFVIDPVEYAASGRYSIAPDVNPNGLGLGFAAGIWAVLYRQHKTKQPLIITGALVALFGYCILMTGSRKSLLGTGLILILWLLFCFLPSLKEKGEGRGIVAFFIMLIIILFIGYEFVNLYANTTISSRMDDLFFEVSKGERSNMYRDGYDLIKQNPLFGIGFQGFQYYYGSYSHSTLVEIPVSGGIIGALLYFYIYFYSLKKIIYLHNKTKREKCYNAENIRIKMVLILWIAMVFNTICIIHPYQFDSCILFGIIFGETASVKKTLNMKQKTQETRKVGSRYLKYE